MSLSLCLKGLSQKCQIHSQNSDRKNPRSGPRSLEDINLVTARDTGSRNKKKHMDKLGEMTDNDILFLKEEMF